MLYHLFFLSDVILLIDDSFCKRYGYRYATNDVITRLYYIHLFLDYLV